MDGSDTIICREDGTWNSTGPICSKLNVCYSVYILNILDEETGILPYIN